MTAKTKAELREWRRERRELPGGLRPQGAVRKRTNPEPEPAPAATKRKRTQVRNRATGAVRPIAECGTLSGYMRHRNQGTPQCEQCLDAKRKYRRAQYAKKNPVAVRKRIDG